MCHIAELVIGGCVLIAMTTLGVVAILGVLGVTQRILELAVELEKDESHEGPQQAPEGEDEG